MLRATLPAPREDAADRSVAEVRTPARREGPGGDLWREVRSADDSDRGWGRDDAPPDDERILREKPPHW